MLPEALDSVNLLILGLDQGSIGCSGHAFAEQEMHALVHAKWDKFHRVVRDVKLALQHAGGGLFLKGQLYSSYLWSVNRRPFGTGAFGEQKRRLLSVFLASQTRESPLWAKYGWKVARDLSMPFDTDEQQQAVWDQVATLSSFNRATEAPKLGRWFSWNSQAHAQMREYHAQKMILEFNLESPDPDSGEVPFDDLGQAASPAGQRAAFASIKASEGGLRLCYMLMTTALLQTAKVIYVATEACWTWYSGQVRDVKTPAQNMEYLLRVARRSPLADPHLSDTIRRALHKLDNIEFMELPFGASKQTTRALDLVWQLLGHRAWSMASRYSIPPEEYVEVFSPELGRREATLRLMRGHWEMLLALEQRRFEVTAARLLWDDLAIARSSPLRLVFMFFERDRWDSASRPGRELLRGLLETCPDNKLVEDMHNVIRRDARGNPNPQQSLSTIQHLCMGSKVLEDRGIPHPVKVTKESFVREFKRAKRKYRKGSHYSWKHTMGRKWSEIMGSKSWPTLSEETGRRQAAAWHWLHAERGGVPLASALLSRLALMGQVVQKVGTAEVYACLGNYGWGALGWPLMPGVGNTFSFQAGAQVGAVWLHITAPEEWVAIPHEAVRALQGIVVKKTADQEPLLKNTLRRAAELSFADLRRLCEHLGLPVAAVASRAELLEAAAAHTSGGDPVFLETVKSGDAQKPCVNLLVEDPVFDAAFNDMEPEDRAEFPEVKEALRRGKIRKTYEASAHRRAAAKAKAKAKGRAKRKALAKASVRAIVGDVPGAASSPSAGVAPPPPLGAASSSSWGVAPPPPLGAAPSSSSGAAPSPPPPLLAAPLPAASRASDPASLVAAATQRNPRAEPFGGEFVLADVHAEGTLTAWSARCFLHTVDGMTCNKSLNMGRAFSAEQAKRRIMKWCLDGRQFPNTEGARELHMGINPRQYREADVPSTEELWRRASR